jgi:hypothetical protein
MRSAWLVPAVALAAAAGCGGGDDPGPSVSRATGGTAAHERSVVRHSVRPRGRRLGVPADAELAAR